MGTVIYFSDPRPGVGNSFWLAGHIGSKYGQHEYHMDLFYLTFERKYAFSSLFSEKKNLRGIFDVLSTLKYVRGPH